MDSVYVHDSVYVYATAERTVETRWRTSWRERTVHDTVIVHTTDTIVKTLAVEKVVTVPAKGMPVVTMGAVLILLMLVVLGWLAVKAYRLIGK